MKAVFTELLGPSLIINLAQLVSPSVALPAELVFFFFLRGGGSLKDHIATQWGDGEVKTGPKRIE